MSITAHEMYCLADDLREFAASLVSKGIVEYVGGRKARLTLGSTLRIDGQYFIVDRNGKEVIAMNYHTDDDGEQRVAAALNFASLYDHYDKQPITLPTGEDVYWGQDMYVVVEHIDCKYATVEHVLLSIYKPDGVLDGLAFVPKSDAQHEIELSFNAGESK